MFCSFALISSFNIDLKRQNTVYIPCLLVALTVLSFLTRKRYDGFYIKFCPSYFVTKFKRKSLDIFEIKILEGFKDIAKTCWRNFIRAKNVMLRFFDVLRDVCTSLGAPTLETPTK